MKFRYYRVSLFNGNVQGTNNEELARAYAESEDDFVIDAEMNKWLHPNGDEPEIEEFTE